MTGKRKAVRQDSSHRSVALVFILVFVFFVLTPAAVYTDNLRGSTIPESDMPVMDGAGVTVTAKNNKPGTIRVNREDIEKSTAQDLVTLLAETVGINTTSHGGYGTVSALSIRGFSTSRIQVHIDGILVSSPQSGDFDFTSIDINLVESITIHYGGSAPVTVDITTRKKHGVGLTWSAGFTNTAWISPDSIESLIDTQRLDFSLGCSCMPIRFRINAFGTRAQNRFPFVQTGRTLVRSGNEMLDGSFSVSADTDISSLVNLSASASFYRAEKNVAGPVTTAAGGEQEDFRSLESISLTAKQFFSPVVWTQFIISHGVTGIDWEDPETESHHILHSIEGSSFVKIFPTKALDLRIRTAWKHDILESTNTSNITRDTVTLETGGEWRPSRQFTVLVDCSLIFSPSLDTPTLMPTVTVSHSFSPETTAGLRVFRTFKMPDMNALYWSGDMTAKGNPDLKNESALSAELFFSHTSSGEFKSDHSLYGTWYRDAIIWQTAAGIWSPENVGKALYIGSEHRLVFTPGAGLTLTLNYTWMFTRALTKDFSFSDGKRMPYQSEHRFSFRLEKSHKRFRCHIAPRYESSRFTTIMNATELPGVFLLDAGVTVKASKQISVFLDGKNLLNEQWMSMNGYPMPTRSVTAGIRVAGE